MKTSSLRTMPGLLSRHLILIYFCVCVVFPIVWAILTSFKPDNEIFSLSLFAKHPTLGNYAAVNAMLPFGRIMVNTFLMSAFVSIGTVLVSIAAAYAFTRWQFPGKNVLFLLFIGTLLIPPQVIIIPNYLLLARLGWLNTLAGLTIPQLAGGFGVFYLRQQFRGFPKELFDAGTIDGANSLRLLWSILLPNMRSALATLAILIFVQTWNEYFWPLMVTRDLSSTVVQVGIQIFLNPASTDWGALMAAATLSLLPVLLLYIFAQRHVKNAFVHSGMNV